jgi:hypothetical protein
MASSLASDKRPDLPAPTDGDAANDPFVSDSSTSAHYRFSNFDQELFAAGPGSSPTQARKALEAHLAETDRRLDEAGKLGTSLVAQRKLLAEQLQEVQKLQAEGELGPDLRKKLVEIERDYNDLARESARVFLPKQRVPSNEAHAGSPFVPERRSGRVSTSFTLTLLPRCIMLINMTTAFREPFQIRKSSNWISHQTQCSESQNQKPAVKSSPRH